MINELIEKIGGRERLEAIVYAMGAEPCDADPILDSVTHGDIGKMARALLSVLDAKPVGYFVNTLDDEGPGFGFMFKNDEGFPGSFPLYATPPADSEPVSEGYTLPDVACDPAKLGTEDTVITHFVAPHGYKLVPIEPTEDMVISGFESKPREGFSDPDDWGAFEAMSGCEQAAHKARLCYTAMLAAAPTPEQ